jgi:transposase
MARLDVLTGPERRRRWSDDQKRAIVAAAFAPRAVVAEVARRADVCPSLIYRWRRELADAPVGFAAVVLATGASEEIGRAPSDGGCGSSMTPSIDGVIEVAIDGAARARIPVTAPPALAAAVVAALVGR